MKKLSIVITCLNEGENLDKTLKSIYSTADSNELDIIIVDDASDEMSTEYTDTDGITYLRNAQRLGVAYSRDLGQYSSTSDRVMMIDAHMRFYSEGWVDLVVDRLNNSPDTLFCSSCIPTFSMDDDLGVIPHRTYGAELVLNTGMSGLARELLEPSWKDKLEPHNKVPCVLGGCYVFNKSHYQKVRGLEGLVGWGGDEQYLSLKYWLSGGSCEVIPELEVAHLFRAEAPYTTDVFSLYFNKMFICATLMPDEIASTLMDLLPKDENFHYATSDFRRKLAQIVEYRNYYKSIFTCDFQSTCNLINMSCDKYVQL